MEIDKILYHKGDVSDADVDTSHVIRQTLNEGINEGGVLCFHIQPDPERFTELNNILLKLQVGILDHRNRPPAFTHDSFTFLDGNGMHSLFSTVEVRINDQVASTMTNYPYSAILSRYLGCSQELREGLWDKFDGTWDMTTFGKSSQLNHIHGWAEENRCDRVILNKTLIGRIYSDILMSARQYLPPNTDLKIVLRRAPDAFSLVTNRDNVLHKLSIANASLLIKRVKLRASAVPRALASIQSGGQITFNRLTCSVISINEGSRVFRWLNCLNNAPLPNRIYVAFVAQNSFYGDITQLSTYFENLNLASIAFKLNGRDLLVTPIRTTFVKDDDGNVQTAHSDALEGYLSIAEIMNQVSDQTTPLRLGYLSYLKGATIYALELGKCGEKFGSAGSMDIEVNTVLPFSQPLIC